MIIDYHAHLKWDRKSNHYNIQELLADMANNEIDKRVVSALHGTSIREQNDVVAKLVNDFPSQLIGCAVINPKAIDCLDELKRIIALDCFKCIELDSLEHNYYPEECDAMDEIFQLCAENQLVINVYTGWGPRTMPAQWAYFAERHPKAKVVLLHMGTTDFGYGCIDLVAQQDNLFVETSCMYELPILRKAFANIDHKKIIFGSHYPHKITKCSIDTFELLYLDQSTKDHLYFENARDILKL